MFQLFVGCVRHNYLGRHISYPETQPRSLLKTLHTQEVKQHRSFDNEYCVAKLKIVSVLTNVIFRFVVSGYLFHSCLVLCEVVVGWLVVLGLTAL